MDHLFISRVCHQEGKTSWPQIWEQARRLFYLDHQLKNKFRKKQFQGIHDRFLRVADEDHTYHLTEKEFFYFKNKRWLHLNKSGSDTVPFQKTFRFKQALSTLERLHQQAGEEQSVPTFLQAQTIAVGIEFVLYIVQMVRFLVVFFKIQKVNAEASKVLGMNGETRYWQYFSENSRRWLTRIQFTLLQIDRLQLTAVYCNRRWV